MNDAHNISPPQGTAPILARSLVLVGLMGAGKTTIGRRLAQKLGVSFKDADAEIELAAGKSVSEIFAEHGEPYFREGEKKVIKRLLDETPMVLATGGGAFMNPDTRRLIREKAVSVWLRADLDVLLKRVLKRNTRPLLAQGDPEATMRRLIDERYPVYAEADITVETRDGPHEDIVDAIITALDTGKWRHFVRSDGTTPHE